MEHPLLLIEHLITQNEIPLALSKLQSILTLSNSELVGDVIMMSGQFKKLHSDIRKGIIDYQQENLQHNRIMNSILSLTTEIKQDPALYEAIEQIEHQLDESVKKKGGNELSSEIKDALFERIAYVKNKSLQLTALWIDDHPSYNVYESRVLNSLGIDIEVASSSVEALQLLTKRVYDVLLSDISRHGNSGEGLRFHKELLAKGIHTPIIFYSGFVDRSKGVPPYAFGIADLPNDLIHLVLDVIVRKY